MKTTPVYVHVGLMKTATTTLQKRVFPAHNDLYYLGGPEYINDKIRLAVAAISKQDRLLFNAKTHKDNIHETLERAKSQEKTILLSAESLSTPTVDRLTKAERLVEVFGDIRIIICLRNPVDLMTSLYGEAIKQLNPRTQRMPSIDDWLAQEWSDQRATRASRILDFSRLIHAYDSILGKKNVCVLRFEDLKDNPRDFSSHISSFLNIDSAQTDLLINTKKENQRLSKLDYHIFKYSKYINKNTQMSISKFTPKSIKLLLKNSLSGTKYFEMSNEWKDRIQLYNNEINSDLTSLLIERKPPKV